MTLSPQDLSEFRHIYLFSQLGEDGLDRVAAHASLRTLESGETLFSQGEACKHFYYVRSGMVKLYRLSPAGEEKVIELIGPRHVFAEAVMFMGSQYPVHAAALETTRLVAFDSSDFADLLRSDVSLCFRLMSAMSMRMHGLVNEIDRLTLHSGTERLIQYLLDQLPEDVPPSPAIRLLVPKQVIASRLGIQPETLSRILAKLRHEKLVEVNDDTILLRDVETLRRHA